MPRSKRISWLNHPHLVIAKANGGTSLFVDDDDFKSYLVLMRQLVRDRLLKVFAYCLLYNEVRLVVLPNRLMLSRIIQRLHGRHSNRMNAKLNRAGHLFRGRFRSLIFNEMDLLDVVRSVHLWPVREGLLRRPELYPYSSHGYYMGLSPEMGDFLSTSDVFQHFSGDLEQRRRAFGRFVESLALEGDSLGIEEIAPGIGGTKQSATDLIARAYDAKKSTKKSSVKTIADRATLLLSIDKDQLLSISRRQDLVMARRLLATAAVLYAGRTVTEVAIFLNRDKAQVSRLVAQGMDLLNSNDGFCHMLDALRVKGVDTADTA